MSGQDQQQVDSESTYVVPAGHKQLYINNLEWNTTNEQLSDFIASATGSTPQHTIIASVYSRKYGTRRSRGYGFVTVKEDKLQQALTLDGKELNGRALSIVEARPRDPNATNTSSTRSRNTQHHSSSTLANNQSDSEQNNQPSVRPARKQIEGATQLYIQNLAFTTTLQQLTDFVKNVVTPVEIEIINNKFGKFKDQSKGFGFVWVNDDKVDSTIHALNGQTLDGRELLVTKARTADEQAQVKANRPRTYNNRGRGGFRRGRGGFRNQSQNGNSDMPNDNRRRA